MQRYDVLILGAGASGLACAMTCGQRGRRVCVVDHAGETGPKVRVSGGGHCNLTNRVVTADDYACGNPHFVKSALAQYPPAQMPALLARHGLTLEERSHGQLFCLQGAATVADVLTREAVEAGARLLLGTAIRDARRDAEGFDVETNQGLLKSRSLVVATGGLAWPQIGATHIGYALARGFGLQVTPLRPALAPLLARPAQADWCRALSGISLPVRIAGARQAAGDLLFTHRGISGPAVLDASLFWRKGDTLQIDFLPGIDLAATLARTPRMTPQNALALVLPRRLAFSLCPTPATIAELSKVRLKELARLVQAFAFEPADTAGYAKAEVTLGGVDTAQISSKTMEVKTIPGLFFIGEALDVTGRLGGFNLQWAWSSGYVAGLHA